MSVEVPSAAGHTELLMRLAQAGARVQRQLSRDSILRSACDALSSLGLRCSIGFVEQGGVRIGSVNLGVDRERLEAAIGEPLVGPLRPMTPAIERLWADGVVYSSEWPDEVAAFVRAPVAALLREIGDGAFTRGIAVRVGDPGPGALLLFATGAWLLPEDVGAFRLFADQVGAALAAASTVARLRERNAELAALNTMAALASGSEDLDALLQAALVVIEHAAGASAVGIVMLGGGPGEPRRVHVTGANQHLAGMLRDAPVEHPVFRSVLNEGKVRVVHGEDVPASVAEVWGEAGVGTIALLPLRFRGDPVGAVAVAFPDRRAADGCHVDLLGAMGGQLGAAIESHTLLTSLRSRVSELTMLNDIAAATVALEPRSLLEDVLARVSATFAADTSALHVDEDGSDRTAAALGFAHEIGSAPPISESDITELATRRKAAVRWPEDVPETPRNRWFRDAEGIRTAVAVPLVARDRTVGSFVLARRTSVRFTDEDVRLLSAVGVQLGVAVDNTRLYEDLRRSYAEIERAQERLIQQERFAALGQLSAVVAHEVRNPLGVIFNAIGTLRRLVQASPDARMLLDIVDEESDRLNRIVGDLLDFARPAPPQLRSEPLGPLVDDAAKAAGLGPAIRFERHLDPLLPRVPMDPRLMRQALVNLFTNAAQAMPAGGTLSVSARLDGDAVRVEVADTGSGIPEELLQRVFEPFFTTRPTGTGLGLAVVKRILDDHRATLRVERGDPIGTRFVVRLPLAGAEATQDG